MDHASASFASPWAAAVLGGHAMGTTNTEHGFGHHGLSMDLHGYSYYRCEENIIVLPFLSSLTHMKRIKKAYQVSSDLWASEPHEKLFQLFMSKHKDDRFLSTMKILFTISRFPSRRFVLASAFA